ncbi:MAG: S-adenosylmethionine decarboxylase [Deinococcales bacterium]
MNGYDTLGYGTHLILDGFRADAARLSDEERVEAVLRSTLVLMGEAAGGVFRLRVAHDGGQGISAALVGAESHLCLHTFPALDKLSLEAFSTRALPTQAITEAFLDGFGVGRYESRVHGRGRLLPRQVAALEQALDGDRDYARLRLRDLLST